MALTCFALVCWFRLDWPICNAHAGKTGFGSASASEQVRAKDRGNERMIKLATLIQEGAKSFLKTEYSYLAVYVACVFSALVLLFTLIDSRTDRTDGVRVGGAFVAGALLSASAGWFGMMIATDANVRTTAAADKNGLNS
jgi:Na+/H+-translocating membrane pyrophosphatase